MGIFSFLERIGTTIVHFSKTLTPSILSQTVDNEPGTDEEVHSIFTLASTGENERAGISESETTLVPDQELHTLYVLTDSSFSVSSAPPTVISSVDLVTSYG
jgi:hypothetical protein